MAIRCSRRLSHTYFPTSTGSYTIAEIKTISTNYFTRQVPSHKKSHHISFNSITTAVMPRALTLQQIEGAKPGKVYYPSELPSHQTDIQLLTVS